MTRLIARARESYHFRMFLTAHRPKSSCRVAELVDENTRYDVKKFLEMMLSAGANILSPFGYTTERLYGLVVQNQKQGTLIVACAL